MRCRFLDYRSLVQIATFGLVIFSVTWNLPAQEEFEVYDNEPSQVPRMTPQEAVQTGNFPRVSQFRYSQKNQTYNNRSPCAGMPKDGCGL